MTYQIYIYTLALKDGYYYVERPLILTEDLMNTLAIKELYGLNYTPLLV